LAQTSPTVAAGELYGLGGAAEEQGAYTLTALAWLEAAQLGHPQALTRFPSAAVEVDGALGRLLQAVAHARDSDDLAALLPAGRARRRQGRPARPRAPRGAPPRRRRPASSPAAAGAWPASTRTATASRPLSTNSKGACSTVSSQAARAQSSARACTCRRGRS